MDAIQSINRKIPELTIRDLFAKQAMVILNKFDDNQWDDSDCERMAHYCYRMADAMIEERRK